MLFSLYESCKILQLFQNLVCTKLSVVYMYLRNGCLPMYLAFVLLPLPPSSFPFTSHVKFLCFVFPRMKTKEEGKTSKRKAKNKIVHTLSCHINPSLPMHILFFLARSSWAQGETAVGWQTGCNHCAKGKHRSKAAITSATPKFTRSYITQPKY